MKVAIASAKFINKDIAFNMAQLERYMRLAKEQGAELMCFSEAFLQGFDAYCWNYSEDCKIAVSTEDDVFRNLRGLTESIGIDVLFGFLEREGNVLYSSCALLSSGEIIHLYRRISRGWKEYSKTDEHYCEGSAVEVFPYRDRNCLIALCGDLWDYPERFALGQDVLFWPVYINYSMDEWANEALGEYARQAALAGGTVMMVNAVTEAPDEPSFGGAYGFRNGEVFAALDMGEEGVLVVEI